MVRHQYLHSLMKAQGEAHTTGTTSTASVAKMITKTVDMHPRTAFVLFKSMVSGHKGSSHVPVMLVALY